MILLLLLGAMFASSAEVSQSNADAAFELDSFRWSAATTPQHVVAATNEWGDLRVRSTDRDALAVSAMIQNIGPAGKQFGIRIEEGSRRVVVTVVPLVPQPRGRVDVTLMVPAGKQLHVATRDGFAEIKYRGEIRARTRSGRIAIDTPAQASARTESGSITAKLSGGARRRPLSFRSGSGDVTVWLPKDAGFTVRAQSRGDIEIGYPHRRGRRGSRVSATIGDGETQVRIESNSGRIRVQPYGAAAAASF